MSVQAITDSELQTTLQQHARAIIKFHAGWCGQCRLIGPKFVKLSNEPALKDVVFLEIDAEHNPEARKLAGVTNLPFFATFKDGQLVKADFTSKVENVQAMAAELTQN